MDKCQRSVVKYALFSLVAFLVLILSAALNVAFPCVLCCVAPGIVIFLIGPFISSYKFAKENGCIFGDK